jgi:nucleotide-binding universal stress UspA family protein
MEMKKILFATDYSEASRHSLPFATSLARDTGAELLIAHVTDRELYLVGERFDEELQPSPAEMHDLKSIVPTDPQVRYEHRLVYGEPGITETVNPAEEIVKLAQEEHVDAIVLGTHGRSGLSHLFMGSVAESVVRKAPCPVVTIKQPKGETTS